VTTFPELLALQAQDTAIDQLRHRRAHLDEQAEVDAATNQLAAAQAEAAPVRAEVDALTAQQRSLEDEAATIEAKAAGVEARLYDGSVVAHKELEDLQADHRSLKARQSNLEDAAIEVMEQIEPHRAVLDGIEVRIAEISSTLADATERRDAALAVVDAELEVDDARRTELAAAVEPSLLATYEELRSRLGGVGAARLEGRRCMGCHIELPSADAQVIRGAPESDVVTCTECGRILIR
jgi:predicted  nucleic acid-binding Zn-ribbon protein